MILGQLSFKLLEAGIGPSSNSLSAASFSVLLDANGFFPPNKFCYKVQTPKGSSEHRTRSLRTAGYLLSRISVVTKRTSTGGHLHFFFQHVFYFMSKTFLFLVCNFPQLFQLFIFNLILRIIAVPFFLVYQNAIYCSFVFTHCLFLKAGAANISTFPVLDRLPLLPGQRLSFSFPSILFKVFTEKCKIIRYLLFDIYLAFRQYF